VAAMKPEIPLQGRSRRAGEVGSRSHIRGRHKYVIFAIADVINLSLDVISARCVSFPSPASAELIGSNNMRQGTAHGHLDGIYSKWAGRSAVATALASAAAALALAGCGGSSPVAGPIAGASGTSSAAAAVGTPSPSYSAAGAAAGSDPATCQQMATAWSTFTAQEQQKPGSGYPALKTALYNLSNYFNLDTVTQGISNLFGDVDSMLAGFDGGSVPASPGAADPEDMASFASDSKTVAKDCGISLPLPKSAQTSG
jgi:hypothetical protein